MDFIDFITSPAVILFLVGAIAALIFAIGVVVYPKIKNRKQGYAYEEELEAALLPFLFNAIASAYKVSEYTMDEMGERLAGADKRKFAIIAYDLLPPKIGRFPVVWVKTLVSQEQFADLVQVAFDQFLFFYEERHENFIELWQEWREEVGSSEMTEAVR
jgi:hypothetical protein